MNMKKKMMQLLASLLTVFIALATAGSALAQTVNSNQNGQGTITITNASQGQTYSIYKLFDATQSEDGISYRLPSGKVLDNTQDWFEADTKGNVLVKSQDVSTPEFKTWAKGFGTKVASAEATENELTFTNVPYGYYYVESSLGGTLTVNSTFPNGMVIDKNETKPTIPDTANAGGKKIKVGSQFVSTTTAKIGDTVSFQIKFNATNHATENGQTKLITKYTVTDTPTALAIQSDSIRVTVGGQDITSKVTKVVEGSGKMTVNLTWVDGSRTLYNSPTEVLITYDALVTKDAATGEANNTATIGYHTSDNPSGPEVPVTPTNPADTRTAVKTYQLTLKKTNAKSETLTGAEFKLYDAETNGTEIKVVKTSEGNYRVAEANEAGVVIAAGTAVIKGLKGDDTRYYLEEIKAPNGYNILTSRQAVTISSTAANSISVINQAGTALPSTGALGTYGFYLIGSVLVLGTLIIIISKRRMLNDSIR